MSTRPACLVPGLAMLALGLVLVLSGSGRAEAQQVGDSLGIRPDTAGFINPGLPRETPGLPARRGAVPGAPLGPDSVGAGGALTPDTTTLGGGATSDTVGAAGGVAGGGIAPESPTGGVTPDSSAGFVGGGIAPDTTQGAGGAAAGPALSEAPRTEPPLPIPEKPPVHQFRLAAELGAFTWDDDAGANDNVLAGFDVERDLAPFLAGRAALAYGTTELAPRAAGRSAGGDVRLYLPEVSLIAQHELPAFSGGELTPYGLVGFGSLISDPADQGSTKSQNAFSYGGGLRLRFGERLGVRGEVKRYLIKLEDPFDPSDQGSESVHNLRLSGSLTYAL